MLHEFLSKRGIRDASRITIINPMSSPVPPSPETSQALLAAFAERDITFRPNTAVTAVDEAARTVTLSDGSTIPCDLFLGIPKNRAPDVVVASGLTENGWVTIDPRTLETKLPHVYALGDLANTGAPKAGIFAEAAAKAVATNLIAWTRGQEGTARNPGSGSCYIAFGDNRLARVDVDFFSGPKPVAKYHEPSVELSADKGLFGSTRRARWFGL